MLLELPGADPELVRFGARVRAAREARGLSVEALASAAELDAPGLRRAEAGRARLDSAALHRVIQALHLPLAWLFTPDAQAERLRRF